MGRPSNTAERRAQIVHALARVMVQKGYGGATIAAIAAEAKLAPGLVHYHFTSKRAVLVALVEQLSATVAARYEARRAHAGSDARLALHAMIDAYLELGPGADTAAVGAWGAIGAEALRDAEVRRLYRRSLALTLHELRRLMRAARRAAGHASRGGAAAAAAILVAIEGALHIGSLAPGVLPRGASAPMTRRLADSLIDTPVL